MILTEGEAAAALAAGEVVAMPTDTVYGLAAVPSLGPAIGRLFALKGRPEVVALPVLVADPAEAGALGELDERGRRLRERYWPGALTLVVPRRPGITFELGGDGSTIGLRCPAHPAARSLLRRTGPLAVTSANRHGEAPCRSAAEVAHAFGEGLGVLDGGPCGGSPSTVVALGSGGLTCLREGAVPMAEIERTLAPDARERGEAPP